MSTSLRDRLDALEQALDAGAARLPEPLVADGRRVVARARERAGLSAEHTVVALAGATGSGKSSLFNVLAGAELATVGVQRPTTGEPMAAVRGDGAGPLLDWLGVRRRHRLASPEGRAGGGLVLLDLPDHDSVVSEHRLRADRLVQRADLLVWVVDPQKYADAALHAGYLRPLAGHEAVVVLVLNQCDRLAADQVPAVLADLRRLAAEDGLAGARAVAVSARTGAGVDELRRLLEDAAGRRRAANDRWTADVRAVASRVVAACGTPSGRRRPVGTDPLVEALQTAAGVPVVVDAVRRSVARRLGARTGWPPVRWVARLRPDPLRRLHLGVPPSDELTRTSLPPATPATRAAAATAVRDYTDQVLDGVPDTWVLAARATVTTAGLPDELDRAVAATPLLPDRPAVWGRVLGWLQWVLLVAAAAGLLWLGGIAGLGYLHLPEPRTPQWGPLPVPTALLLGGVGAGLVVAALGALLARVAAHRRAAAVGRRLGAAVQEVARRMLVQPLAVTLDDLRTCRESAARAAG